jgi:DNA (cytosine-5)-methyltransferase 1
LKKNNSTFIDLFAGLGGFHLAAKSFGLKCVFASEINEELRVLYQKNFEIEPAGDIRLVQATDIPAHRFLFAGFPCTPFSKAGRQEGFEDEKQGKLIWEVSRILKAHRPEFFVLENIAHFVNHDDGGTYRTLQKSLEVLEYDIKRFELSPHQFGVPQIRKRMYLVGRDQRKGNLNDLAEPQTIDSEVSIKTILDSKPKEARDLPDLVDECLGVWQEFLTKFPSAGKLPGTPIWGMEFGATYPFDVDSLYDVDPASLRNRKGSFGQSLRVKKFEDLLERVPSHARRAKGAFPKWKQAFIRNNRKFYQEHKSWIDGWLPNLTKFPSSYQKLEWHCGSEERDIWNYVIRFRASGVRVKMPTTSPSLVAMTPVQIPIIGWEKRYMTMRECARLQSMDDLEHLPDTLGKSTQALGNAVNVTVVSRILENLLELSRTTTTPERG